MKKILHLLLLVPIVAFLAGCVKEPLSFSHEQAGFDTQSDKILIEAVSRNELPGDTYIAGPAIGDSASVVNNPDYKLVRSETVSVKYGVYLDPSKFLDGKTLADGFYFFSTDEGQEMTGVGEEILHTIDNAASGGRYEVYMTGIWRSSFMVVPEIEHDGPVIFIDDQTGWDAIALYMWGDVNNLNGDWPGMQVTGTEKKAGRIWKYFDIGEANRGLKENLIFNNNDNGTQLPDYNVTLDRNYYFVVTADGITEVEVDEGGLPEHEGYRVYAEDQTGWDVLALYMWGDVNNYGGDWPGVQAAGTETIAGVVYKYYEYGDDLAGLGENLIFNNNDNGTQLADIKVKFTEDVKDYFFVVTSSGATQIPNPMGGGDIPGPEPEPVTYDGPRIYVQNNTSWPGKLYAHYWGDDFSTEWPGTELTETETIDGVDYLVLPTLTTAAGQSVGIIFHSDEDDENNRFQAELVLDTDRYYVLENDALTEVEAGVRIIVKDESGWPGNIFAHIWIDDVFSTEWPGIKATDGFYGEGTYRVFLVPLELKGQTVNVIFHSDQDDGINRYQTTVTLDQDRRYILGKEYTFGDLEDKTVTIYVDDRTGWDAMALYLWGDVNNLGGDWPGIQLTRTEEIMGTTFKVFEVPGALGLKEVLIFNNNNGVQLANYPDDNGMLFEKSEYFFVVTAEGVTPSERPTFDPAKRVTLYVDNQTGWDAIALYLWGDIDALGGGWPGVQPAGKETIDGKEYTTFVIDNALGLSENLIFNNNNNGIQLGDYAFSFEKNQYYFKVTAEGVTLIE